MRTTFDSAIADWISLMPKVESDWGHCLQTLEGHSEAVSSVAFSHDSALVASASYDRTVRVWRADSGECLQTLEGHSGAVTSVAFSHDSALVASASWDQTVRVWRADSGECLQTLEGHSEAVSSVAFSHDSALVASASWDRTVRVWRADSGECVQNVDIGAHSSYLLFDPYLPLLRTSVGAITLYGMASKSTSIEPLASCRFDCGISNDRCWITWNGDNLIWLPVEARPGCSASLKSTVVIGGMSGRVIFIKLLPQELPAMT